MKSQPYNVAVKQLESSEQLPNRSDALPFASNQRKEFIALKSQLETLLREVQTLNHGAQG